MIVYIPKRIDIYNTHLKNLVEEYTSQGVHIILGFETFIYGSFFPDVIHFHMVEGLLGYMAFDEEHFFNRLEFFKKHGVRFLYTAHDLLPHTKSAKVDYTSFFIRFLPQIDLFIHHGALSIEIFKEKFFQLKNKKHIVCHHGDYLKDMKDYSESKDEAKRLLKLPKDKKIILVFGQLQFKNPTFTKKVFKKVNKNSKDCMLVMAGIYPILRPIRLNQIFYKLNNKYINKFRKKTNLIYGRFSNYETFLIFKSADIIFLPHSDGLTSGIIPMAATLSKPFVYPKIGVFEEQAEYCICEKYERLSVEGAYKAILKLLADPNMEFDNTEWLKNNTWQQHVKLILDELNI